MIVPYWEFLLWGGLGGLARALVGIVKEARKEKEFKPHLANLTWNILGSIGIGAVVGLIIDTNVITGVTGGYAGIDLLSNLPRMLGK